MNGKSRATRTGSQSQRRVWKCGSCRKQFSVLTDTIMHGTKIAVRTWVLVLFEMCASKNGVSAREIERKYDLTPRSAWFLAHRIREAMRDNGLGMFVGTITADETWIGGTPINRHGHKRRPGKSGVTDKTPVLSLVDRASGAVRSKVSARSSVSTSTWPGRCCTPTPEGNTSISAESSSLTRRSITRRASTSAATSAPTTLRATSRS
jgi:hypothetical protein